MSTVERYCVPRSAYLDLLKVAKRVHKPVVMAKGKKDSKGKKKKQQTGDGKRKKITKKRQGSDFIPDFIKFFSCYNILGNTPNRQYSHKMKSNIIKHMTNAQINGLKKPLRDILQSVIVFPEKKQNDLIYSKIKSLRAFNKINDIKKAKSFMIKQNKQKGGFLSVLIPLLTTLASEGLGQLIKRI